MLKIASLIIAASDVPAETTEVSTLSSSAPPEAPAAPAKVMRSTLQVTTAFLDAGADQIRAWHKAGEVSDAVIKRAIKSLRPDNAKKLQELFNELRPPNGRGMFKVGEEREVIANGGGDDGDGAYYARFPAAEKRSVFSVKCTAPGEFLVKLLAKDPPAKRDTVKKATTAEAPAAEPASAS